MKPVRIPCVVPYCRRTIKDTGEFDLWICGIHWRLVDKRLKRRIAKVRRVIRRSSGRHNWRARLLHSKIWHQCQAQAIERAMGL